MISIIVPIYNGEKFLPKFLESIVNQECKINKFELILIDNNSKDNTKNLIDRFKLKNHKINCSYIFYNEKSSSYASRNVGVKQSQGDILAFTDVDCILDKDWLINIQNILNNINDIVVSGMISLYFEDKRNIWENFDKIVHMRNDERIDKKEIATANMAISKKIFNRIGFFDEVTSGGDFNFAKRAIKNGFKIKFCNNVKVLHPTRKSYSEIKKKLLRLSFGEGELYKKHKKSLLKGLMLNFLRLFNLPKHLKISRKMIKNTGVLKVVKFNIVYFYIKILQFNEFRNGYKI